MLVAIITNKKAEELLKKEYVPGVKFNPVEYGEDYIISLVEAQYLSVDDIIRLEEYVQPEVDHEN